VTEASGKAIFPVEDISENNVIPQLFQHQVHELIDELNS